ncbi:MAG: hypothetical protein Unbinned200contig1000_49 [Prokaryotic dsDNA virus sp.]|nr:MAG: hypothetical protein Unbinned200contig1000_49 [Prokaryotic dsDNA virus sp.]
MAALNGKNGKIFECDDCGDQTGDETQDFYQAWEDAEAEGWRFYGYNIHRCERCANDLKR